MPRKRMTKPKPDDPEEYKRFLETAKTHETDLSPEALDRELKRVAKPSKKSGSIR